MNHWVCSHDNVWCAAPDFADVVKEAVRRARNEASSLVVYGKDGEFKDIDELPKTLHYKNVVGDTQHVELSTAELLQTTAGTADWRKLEARPGLGFQFFILCACSRLNLCPVHPHRSQQGALAKRTGRMRWKNSRLRCDRTLPHPAAWRRKSILII